MAGPQRCPASSGSTSGIFRDPDVGNVPKQPPAVGHPGKAEGGAGCKAEGGRGGAVAPVKMN